MAEARTEHDWAQTSALLALIANVHRDPRKTRVFKPADFNPTPKQQHEHQGKADIQMLKKIFVNPRPRKVKCDTQSDNSPSTGSPGSSAPSSS